jgi:hypothetical protein
MLLNRISDPVDCANVGGTGRRAACTRCRAIRPTIRNRAFGSLAELGARHQVDMPRWVAPADAFRVVNGPRGQSANRRRHKPALSRTGEGGWHRAGDSPAPGVGRSARPSETAHSARWPNWVPGTVLTCTARVRGTGQGGWHRQRWGVAPADAFHVVNEPRGQSANRRRHQPALSRTGRTGPHLTPSNSPLMSSGRNSSPPAQGFPGSDYTFSSRPHQQSE